MASSTEMPETSPNDSSDAASAQNLTPPTITRAGNSPPECEHSKYDRLIGRLREEEARRGATEDELLKKKNVVTEACKRRSSQKNTIVKRIRDGAAKLERALLYRRNSAYWFGRYMSKVNEASQSRLFTHKFITIAHEEGGESRTVCVKTGLQNTRYYWGHKGGDYIFRYFTPLFHQDGIHPTPEKTAIRGEGHPISHHSGYIVPTEELENLKYWGQVPRPAKEYLARLRLVTSYVVKVVVKVLETVTGGVLPLPAPDLLALTQPGHPLTYSNLARLAHTWFSINPCHPGHKGMVQQHMRIPPRIPELAHLIWVLHADARGAGSHLMREFEPLIHILEDGTGWSFHDMVQQYEVITASMAMSDLIRGENLSHILIFEDLDIKEDIHKFYKHKLFTVDPVHPYQQYRRIDCSASLKLVRQFQDDNKHKPDIEPGPSNSEFKEPPDESEDETPPKKKTRIESGRKKSRRLARGAKN